MIRQRVIDLRLVGVQELLESIKLFHIRRLQRRKRRLREIGDAIAGREYLPRGLIKAVRIVQLRDGLIVFEDALKGVREIHVHHVAPTSDASHDHHFDATHVIVLAGVFVRIAMAFKVGDPRPVIDDLRVAGTHFDRVDGHIVEPVGRSLEQPQAHIGERLPEDLYGAQAKPRNVVCYGCTIRQLSAECNADDGAHFRLVDLQIHIADQPLRLIFSDPAGIQIRFVERVHIAVEQRKRRARTGCSLYMRYFVDHPQKLQGLEKRFGFLRANLVAGVRDARQFRAAFFIGLRLRSVRVSVAVAADEADHRIDGDLDGIVKLLLFRCAGRLTLQYLLTDGGQTAIEELRGIYIVVVGGLPRQLTHQPAVFAKIPCEQLLHEITDLRAGQVVLFSHLDRQFVDDLLHVSKFDAAMIENAPIERLTLPLFRAVLLALLYILKDSFAALFLALLIGGDLYSRVDACDRAAQKLIGLDDQFHLSQYVFQRLGAPDLPRLAKRLAQAFAREVEKRRTIDPVRTTILNIVVEFLQLFFHVWPPPMASPR